MVQSGQNVLATASGLKFVPSLTERHVEGGLVWEGRKEAYEVTEGRRGLGVAWGKKTVGRAKAREGERVCVCVQVCVSV